MVDSVYKNIDVSCVKTPIVLSVSPNKVLIIGGTKVEIFGDNFDSIISVSFGEINVDFEVVNSTIFVNSPAQEEPGGQLRRD